MSPDANNSSAPYRIRRRIVSPVYAVVFVGPGFYSSNSRVSVRTRLVGRGLVIRRRHQVPAAIHRPTLARRTRPTWSKRSFAFSRVRQDVLARKTERELIFLTPYLFSLPARKSRRNAFIDRFARPRRRQVANNISV